MPFTPVKPDDVACLLHVVRVVASDGERLVAVAKVALTVTLPQ